MIKPKKLTQREKDKLRRKCHEALTVEDWGDDDDNFHDNAHPEAVIALLDEIDELKKKVKK
ncbi:hypothetical protein QMM96_22080 [Citrobacter freundii]|uniref:hypothetical protein n=1 Tax=Citrobacter freundii TaxID=546 RepID=UPI002B24BD79|nr:hypothetical protein [Citrobacter freundii]MEB2478121.1 hypothetical protein [Citrobacter freundii]